MKTFKTIRKSLDKGLRGLDKDIAREEALIEKRKSKISKLEEQISVLKGENVLSTFDIKSAQIMKNKLSEF